MLYSKRGGKKGANNKSRWFKAGSGSNQSNPLREANWFQAFNGGELKKETELAKVFDFTSHRGKKGSFGSQ